MSKRIAVISSAAMLRHELGSLVICRESLPEVRIPVEDLGLLVLEDSAILITTTALAKCMEHGAAVVVCDSHHMPTGLLVPIAGHSLQVTTMRSQVAATEPTKKRIWQKIVRAKIANQARVLEARQLDPTPVAVLEDRVRSGDVDNVEARAARIYWPLLFGPSFRRNRDASGANALLNYGYALIRAATARAIVGAGLTPSFGVHHHNQYDTFCLADDLFEPLRPMVDLEVYRMTADLDRLDVNPQSKHRLLTLLTRNLTWSGAPLPLFEAMVHYCASFREALQQGPDGFRIPDVEFSAPPAE